MPADFTIKSGDQNPAFLDTLKLKDGTVPPLAGASIVFVMRSFTSATPVALTGTASIVTPVAGRVQFAPTAADTATAGQYMANWIVTFAGGSQMTFPTEGFLWVSVEESLTEGFVPRLIGLPELKDRLDVPSSDHRHDQKLLGFIDTATPLIENVVGPVLVRQFEEWHDGGGTYIKLRRTPSRALGTSPVLTLLGCSEYLGPIEWPLKVIASPDQGQLYSCMLDASRGRVVRRAPGGGLQAFPGPWPQAVHVVYEAGQQTVPANVKEAAIEVARANYMITQNVGVGEMVLADSAQDNIGPQIGFVMPHEALKLLAPNRRYPSLA